jgi:hypothetical protein
VETLTGTKDGWVMREERRDGMGGGAIWIMDLMSR